MPLTDPIERGGNVASTLPFSDSVFAKHEINFCCLDRCSLEEDTRPVSLKLSSILDRIRSCAVDDKSVAFLVNRSLNELVEYILQRLHRPIGALLLNVETLIDMVAETHGDEIGYTMDQIRIAFVALRGELLEHLLKEEDILFPWIISGNNRSTADIIDDMRHQHQVIAMKMKTVLALASRLPGFESACDGRQALYTTLRALETELVDHIRIENNLLYPRALRE